MASSSAMHWMYIVRCRDGSLYIGETNDVAARVSAHNEGRSLHTAKLRPVAFVYSEQFENRILALRRERQVQRWTVAKKEALVAGDIEKLRRL